MFYDSQFNGDISQWNVSKVEDMGYMFYNSKFNGHIEDWQPLSLKSMNFLLDGCGVQIPYWAKIDDFQERQLAIEAYHVKKLLEQSLKEKEKTSSIIKI